MAIRVNFSQLPENVLRDGFSELLVLGVRTTDQQAELEALLEAHRYTHGLDVIPQGTPTNATETAAPGISLERPDLAAVRASELGIAKVGPLPPPARRAHGRGRPGHAGRRGRGRPVPHDGRRGGDRGARARGRRRARARRQRAAGRAPPLRGDGQGALARTTGALPRRPDAGRPRRLQPRVAARLERPLRARRRRAAHAAGGLPAVRPAAGQQDRHAGGAGRPGAARRNRARPAALPLERRASLASARLDPEAGDAAPGEGERAALGVTDSRRRAAPDRLLAAAASRTSARPTRPCGTRNWPGPWSAPQRPPTRTAAPRWSKPCPAPGTTTTTRSTACCGASG